MFTPRAKQQEVLSYRQGKMGVSAVPGSGKTYTLSALAARIIASGFIGDEQEVLIVTLVNSAVDNFSARVGGFIQEMGLLPHVGYRVRTLHGLAHDIVRERPSLVGLERDFQIIDERAAEQVRQEAAYAWLRAHPYALDEYLDPDMEESKREWVRRDQLPDLIDSLALSFIRFAKDEQITPAQLLERLSGLPVPLPLAEIGTAIYADYQRALTYRGAVDFDDLIRLALQALKLDENYLERMRQRWPYILEDEAQDSSQLQEETLRLLSGPTGNWVRVGDPNQAIYETFTTASPEFLMRFLEQADVTRRELPDSGRSSASIIKLANYLIDWTRFEHPIQAARDALQLPLIRPTDPGDPQSNPPDDPSMVRLILQKMTPQEEVIAVARSVETWLKEHPDDTVAVLVPRNQRGFDLVNELKRRKIDYVEILRSTSATRAAAGALRDVLAYLSDPQSAVKLAGAYRAWRRPIIEETSAKALVDTVTELLRKCGQVEDLTWPQPDRDWLEGLKSSKSDQSIIDELMDFRTLVQRWHGTTMLPIDQMVLTLAQDLFTEPTDLAIAHKLAVILRQAGNAHLEWRLPELTEELAVVARNERRFLGFSEDDTGFQPDRYRGKVVVATIHKAKGLEWDRVYLMSVNNYDFPSGMPFDHYMPERWFLRRGLNLEAEALAQLRATMSYDPYAWYEEGVETQAARLDYVRERLRLFYVGITRAKKELVITWNTGRQGDQKPALALLALKSYWEKQMV
jgi:DNA helicase-2/ATP-dependent DNA helicase PcrA